MKKLYFFLAFSCVGLTSGYAQWSLTGNAIAATNFLGTTNAQPLNLKVNNQVSGIIDPTNLNVFFGYQAGNVNTGINNTGLGYQALYNNTTGHSNVALGFQPLLNNTTGDYNTAIGNNPMGYNSTGSYNNATGSGALFHNTLGNQNVVDGWNAMFYNTTGSWNTAIGAGAINENTTGFSNVAVGVSALFNNTTGTNMIAIGDSALFNERGSAGWNTAVGSKALYSNTTGNGNTALGYQTMYDCTTCTSNVALGYACMTGMQSGDLNIAIGPGALVDNASGTQNTATGYLSSYFSVGNYNTSYGAYSLETNTSGSENTGLGCGADVNMPGYSNSTAVGYAATITQSNEVIPGNSSVTLIGGSVGWSVISDGRYKKNIKEDVPGLAFINQLRPVTYNLDVTGLDKFLHPSQRKAPTDARLAVQHEQPAPQDEEAIKQKEQVNYTGFIAQDVAATAQKLNYDFSGVHIPQGDKDLYSLDYAKFVVPLVKAVQELSSARDSLVSVIDSLRAADQNLQNQVTEILQELKSLKGATATLGQNAPNPFSATTTINYYLPPTASQASLTLMDANGTVLKSVTLENKGQGQATISAGDLAPGAYFYTLVVNDHIVATRKMLIVR